MKRLSNQITNKLIHLDIVQPEARELYVYGFWQGFILILNLITVIIIGFLFEMLWQSLTFMLVYGMLRPVAGGYHARTQRNCYIYSVLLLFIVLAIIRWFPWNILTTVSITALSVITVFTLALVEDEIMQMFGDRK